MKLDKENMRKMRQLILFTIIILIALWNYKMIFDAIRFVFGIIFPGSSFRFCSAAASRLC